MSTTETELAVVVTKPGYDIVRIGPFPFEFQARGFAHSLEFRAFQSVRPEGTTVSVEPYNAELPHTPLPPNDPYALADLMDSEPEHGEVAYPDLWTRLEAHYGYDEAAQVWRAACSAYDDLHSDATA